MVGKSNRLRPMYLSSLTRVPNVWTSKLRFHVSWQRKSHVLQRFIVGGWVRVVQVTPTYIPSAGRPNQ